MPIYAYICDACGTEFEQITSFSDRTMPACPACHERNVERKLSTPAIHFKGSGWYINDSKNGRRGGGDAHKDGEGAGAESTDGEKDTRSPVTEGPGAGEGKTGTATSEQKPEKKAEQQPEKRTEKGSEKKVVTESPSGRGSKVDGRPDAKKR